MSSSKLFFLTLTLGLIVLSPGCTKITYTKTDSGLNYFFFKDNKDGSQGKVKDIYGLNITALNPNDSVIFSEFNSFLRIPSPRPADFYEALELLKEGDSVAIQIPGNNFFVSHGFPLPPEYQDTSRLLTLFIGVKNILSKEAHFIAKCEEEIVNMNSFIQRKGWEPQKDSTGIRYEITKKNDEGRTINYGDTVWISYVYYTMVKEKIIVKSKEGDYFKLIIGNPANRVVGLDRLLTYAKEGEEVRAILPFSEAFGEAGYQPFVEPYETLSIELTVEKVKPSNPKK